MALPTNVTASTTGHAALHNNVNAAVNSLMQDTGRRDVTALLINGWTATAVEIQRRGSRSFLRFAGLNGAAASSSRFMEMPAGFQPPYVLETGPQRDSTSTMRQGVTLSLSGGFTLPTGTVLGSVTREISWECLVSAPTTLPGAPIA